MSVIRLSRNELSELVVNSHDDGEDDVVGLTEIVGTGFGFHKARDLLKKRPRKVKTEPLVTKSEATLLEEAALQLGIDPELSAQALPTAELMDLVPRIQEHALELARRQLVQAQREKAAEGKIKSPKRKRSTSVRRQLVA